MNVEKIEKIEYVAYEKLINIDLFNKIITFITSTRNSEGTLDILREIEKKCIWFKQNIESTIQEEYKFQYFGELLERYEERIGNNIKDIRAIALALGYASKLVEDYMIIGTQLVDFINKIKSIAENDLYLKAALYLYDNNKYYIYSEELIDKEYTNTEDIIFALSIFYERIEDFFAHKRKQIMKLIGKDKSISIFGNVGIYAWLIKNIYPLIYKDRKKDIAVLKAFIKIPTGFQQEDTTVYNELINNGYSKEEIAYLNYLILYYSTVPNNVRLGNSIVEEKIAINLCIILINSENSYEKHIYNLIRKILEKYDKFDIKCYGYSRIKDAIEYKINVKNPITFAELYYELGNKLYSFNILDEKWDIVATEADSEKYERIFDYFLLFSKYNKEKLNECINKYNRLTNKNYIESFFKYKYNRESIFKLLVESNIILLKDIFEYVLANNQQKRESHLAEYIKGINNKKSFEFLKYILRLNKYNIVEISELGFCFEELMGRYVYYYDDEKIYDIDIERKFLDTKEQKILFNCLEKFIFYKKPKAYLGFLKAALESDIILKFFKKAEIRKLYLNLCEIKPKTYKIESMQEKYLTAEEMNNIREQKRIEKELKEEQKLFEAKERVRKKFNEMTDKNGFENLYKFCDRYEFYDTERKFSIELAKKYILDNINKFKKENREIVYFMEILKFFMEKNELTLTEFTEITYEYIKEEVKKNEYINSTC